MPISVPTASVSKMVLYLMFALARMCFKSIPCPGRRLGTMAALTCRAEQFGTLACNVPRDASPHSDPHSSNIICYTVIMTLTLFVLPSAAFVRQSDRSCDKYPARRWHAAPPVPRVRHVEIYGIRLSFRRVARWFGRLRRTCFSRF